MAATTFAGVTYSNSENDYTCDVEDIDHISGQDTAERSFIANKRWRSCQDNEITNLLLQKPGSDSFEIDTKSSDGSNGTRSKGDTFVFSDIVTNEDILDDFDIERKYYGNKTTTTRTDEDALGRLTTLSKLREEGFIDTDEYERRKCAIIDEITNTSSIVRTLPQRRAMKHKYACPVIVLRPPDFTNIQAENCIKHVFNYDTRQWTAMKIRVKLDEQPFAKGSLRLVYHLQDLELDADNGVCKESFVAKLAIDPDEDPQTYFRDIELQEHCAHYAKLYNEYNPPKKVEFIKAWVLELTERDGALCGVERFIDGPYLKHNNNYGCVSDEDRNTPQAFSHFTYEASNHELLAVDIQGVGDLYTDPQIHTLNGNNFGKGNLGVRGFQKFIQSHRCNSVCRYLKLPPINPKDDMNDCGTVPIQRLMAVDSIRPVQFESKHYYEHAPLLQKYLSQCREEELQQFKERSSKCCGLSCNIM